MRFLKLKYLYLEDIEINNLMLWLTDLIDAFKKMIWVAKDLLFYISYHILELRGPDKYSRSS